MPFTPNTGGEQCALIHAGATSQRMPLPPGAGQDCLVLNDDGAQDAFIDFGGPQVEAKVPVAGGPNGSMIIPGAVREWVELTIPAGATHWAAIAGGGTPNVYLVRGRAT